VDPASLSMIVVGLPGPSGFASRPGAAVREGHTPSGHLRRFRTWDGRSPVELLSERFDCPVHIENDANLAALGEVVSGAASGLDTVLHISLAHGTGAGLVIGGRLHRGRSGLAGEIGHLHADDEGRLCQCGARGCFWHTRSVPALLDALGDAHGRAFTETDIALAAAEDDQDVVRALLGFGHALGRRLADAVVFIDPDAIVVDGSLGAASEVIAEGVHEAIRRYAPPTMARSTQIMVGTLGVRAPLLGAVGLARGEGLFNRASISPSNAAAASGNDR
jgi:predicted NBD/HSP70 family sugar kinase